MQTIHVLTHRGLEPSKENFYSESTLESFLHHLQRGFGLEVDLNFTKDGIVFCHDASLKRLTNGRDQRMLKDLTTAEACAVALPHGRLGSLVELMSALRKYPEQMIALHFKGAYQHPEHSLKLIEELSPFEELLQRVLVFDVTLATAIFLKEHLSQLQLAASVAHPYDIERYQVATHGTLVSIQDFLAEHHLYDWAWLDEWDLANRESDGKINLTGKQLYCEKTFQLLRAHHIKIALVTPELHGSSPALLGGEAHPDAQHKDSLFARISDLLALKPNAVCTDYPEEVRRMLD